MLFISLVSVLFFIIWVCVVLFLFLFSTVDFPEPILMSPLQTCRSQAARALFVLCTFKGTTYLFYPVDTVWCKSPINSWEPFIPRVEQRRKDWCWSRQGFPPLCNWLGRENKSLPLNLNFRVFLGGVYQTVAICFVANHTFVLQPFRFNCQLF